MSPYINFYYCKYEKNSIKYNTDFVFEDGKLGSILLERMFKYEDDELSIFHDWEDIGYEYFE